ncbi:hypothetical protein B296_00026376 [Ensete ventricosum]|uniref:Uncharacterized protein n=1 Tax=Ensete ventricosum TaxID=4639 RepID=A0A426XTE9_ENSVE|nr:hypothetical protein B296_00026376 [Ensete ventricosum]
MQSGDDYGGRGGCRGGNDRCGWGDRQRWLQQKRRVEGVIGRRQLLRQGRLCQVVDDRSRCDSGGRQPLGCGKGSYVGSSGDRGDNKMGATGSNARRWWLRRRRWLWASDGGTMGEGSDDAGRSVSISLVPSAEEAEDRCGWEWLQTSDYSSRFWRGRGALARMLKIARGAVAGEEEGAAVRQPARRVCDSSRRALLGRKGIVGRRSYSITIKQRGGARRWPQEKRDQTMKERRDLHKKEINREKGQQIRRGRGRWCHRDNTGR